VVIKLGGWFEIDLVSGVYKVLRIGSVAFCYGYRKSPRNYFDAWKLDGCYYLLGFDRELMISMNG
jgi:hypothetical protein